MTNDLPPERRHLRRILLAVVAIGAAAIAGAWYARRGASRPNVLVIVMDTVRADRCSVMGYARKTTPRLDEFAKDAVAFRNAWSSSNWTGPSHASLFTGLGSFVHGFTSGQRPFLVSGHPTLAERLASEGYATACFSNNPVVAPAFGLTRGFETIDPLYERDRRTPWARETHVLAAAWAEEAHASGKPFFLFINDLEPHQPYAPPQADQAEFVRGNPKPSDLLTARAFESFRSLAYTLGHEELDPSYLALLSDLYDAEIRSLDREIGTLFDRLKSSGLLDSTVVVLVSDHGEMLGEGHMIEHGIGLHRAVLHVPLVVRFPGAFDGGRVVTDVVRIEDVAPTILDLCGLPELDGATGVSLLDDTSGRIARADHPPDNWVGLRAIRDFPKVDSAKLRIGIESVLEGRYHLQSFSDGHVELYDVVADPDERSDLSAREPGEVQRLRRHLRTDTDGR